MWGGGKANKYLFNACSCGESLQLCLRPRSLAHRRFTAKIILAIKLGSDPAFKRSNLQPSSERYWSSHLKQKNEQSCGSFMQDQTLVHVVIGTEQNSDITVDTFPRGFSLFHGVKKKKKGPQAEWKFQQTHCTSHSCLRLLSYSRIHSTGCYSVRWYNRAFPKFFRCIHPVQKAHRKHSDRKS